MTLARRRPIGRIGRPHGTDGTVHVDGPSHPLPVGTMVWLAGVAATVERRAGTDTRPLLRLSGVADRDAATALRGVELSVALDDAPLQEGEWLAEDLVGCTVEGLGRVRGVIAAPSCDLLEVGEQRVLVPFVRDAIRHVDAGARRIDVDRRFLGLPPALPEGPTC